MDTFEILGIGIMWAAAVSIGMLVTDALITTTRQMPVPWDSVNTGIMLGAGVVGVIIASLDV
jgi:hypothetical protein